MRGNQTTSIPSTWKWYAINEIATTATGGTPSRTVGAYFGGGIPWVKSGELGDSHVFHTEETLTELGLQSSNAKLFSKGTLCIALYGVTVGKLGILEVDAATNQAVCGIFLPPTINRDYVFHYLSSIRKQLIEQGKGGAQSNISNGLVRQTKIPVAPFNEQNRIVAKIEELFSDLDAGVAALQRAKANLKRYRAAVLKAAVEGKLTEAWRAKHPNTEPASKLLERILTERRQKWEADQLAKFAAAGKQPPKNWREKYVEPSPPETSGLPELPKGWCWASVGQLFCIASGEAFKKTEYSKSGLRLLQIANVGFSEILWEQQNWLPASYSNEYPDLVMQPGDIVLALNRPIIRDRLKVAQVLGDDLPSILYQRVARLRPVTKDTAKYLYEFLNSPQAMLSIKKGLQGTDQPYLNTSLLPMLLIPFPSLKEQEQIAIETEQRLSVIASTAKQLERDLLRATRLRQSILKQAFEGKLVPQDPGDEPAGVMLKRLSMNSPANIKQKVAGKGRSRRVKQTPELF